MNRIYQVVILCYLCLILFVIMDCAGDKVHHRSKRFLSFRNVSHFFLRLNFKANMVRWNQIFAQALGYRMNWDDPPDSFHPYHHLSRRTVYNHLELLLDRNGINGFHCIRRAICETKMMSESSSIYFKLLKMVFRQQGPSTNKWHNVTEEDCDISIYSCPFSMLEVLPYTDI